MHDRVARTGWKLSLVVLGLLSPAATAAESKLRPPAVPLVACDPYFSVWSQADQLWKTDTTHWTGRRQRLGAVVRIDGRGFRLMGAAPQTLAALPQTSVAVLPTRTVYEFVGEGVRVTLTFTTPALPDDLAILSRPTTYIDCTAASLDGRPHDVDFYFDAGGELAANTPDQTVTGEPVEGSNAVTLQLGRVTQPILGRSGDDLRIDWGYLYVSAAKAFEPTSGFGEAEALRAAFGRLGPTELSARPQPAVVASSVVAAVAMTLGSVGAEPVSRYALIAYDDLYSIEYMRSRLRPYWRKDGWEASDLISAAINEHDELFQRCRAFDEELLADLQHAGGREYADIAALAYRQCFAAGKFVADANGQPLQFCKENHSNGCIATSDVFYPMAPQFLLFGPTVTKSMLVPFMEYAASQRWKFPFAPHDLGTYPKANGQRYGGGETSEENQMPVEESGNLLILFGALAQMEGNADFAALYWKQISQWAAYLEAKGFDPENQLCTDDFAGHMAHNVNLSAKAICGLGAYAKLCELRGLQDEAARYRQSAKKFAGQWVEAARDGDHYRLAFDRPGTWSQKYNLIWDRLLGLDLFPADVYTMEMAYYRRIQREYGLPLDNRSDYTKLDWILWTATLTGEREDFDALVRPVHHFLQATPDRSPMTDWYFSSTAKKVGFTARPVVGGVFLKLLYDPSVWTKYAARDKTRAQDWAPMPTPPQTKSLVATSDSAETEYHYTTRRPDGDWFAVDYAVAGWSRGRGGLGTSQTPRAPVHTTWDSRDIWVRRTVTLPDDLPARPALRIWHDEDVEVYLNGQLVAELGGYTTEYETIEVPAAALQSGLNVIAIHCRQTNGGQFIDCGLEAIVPGEAKASGQD